MALEIGLELVNVLIGIGSIGTGVGFSEAEEAKKAELDAKTETLREAVKKSSNLYDNVYFMVTKSLERVTKALEKLPSDLIDKVQKQLDADTSSDDSDKALSILSQVLDYGGTAVDVTGSIAEIVCEVREKRAKAKAKGQGQPDETPSDPSETSGGPSEETSGMSGEAFEDFESIEGEANTKETVETVTTLKSSRLDKALEGLNIAGTVFGVAGLGVTIGMGEWTLAKLNSALDDVAKKLEDMTNFQKGMEKVLDQMLADAGLPAKKYDDLTKLAHVWKQIAENCDSYEKTLKYAIQGYFQNRGLDAIKRKIKAVSDPAKPFPEDGYALAKVLADGIRKLFDQNKTDEEVIDYFATDNPNIGMRLVLSGYFVSLLRSGW